MILKTVRKYNGFDNVVMYSIFRYEDVDKIFELLGTTDRLTIARPQKVRFLSFAAGQSISLHARRGAALVCM